MHKNRRDLYHRMRLLIHPQFDMICVTLMVCILYLNNAELTNANFDCEPPTKI